MSHVPTVLKLGRSVFDKMLPVDDNDSNAYNMLLQANAPTYRVQTFLIKCTLNGYIRCHMSAEFQRGLGWSKPLLRFMSKYCLMILLITLTYVTLSDL